MSFKISLALILCLGFLTFFVNQVIFAASSTPGFRDNVCSRLTSFVSKMEARVSEREQGLRERHQERQKNGEGKVASWDEKREQGRVQAETRMSEFFLRLEARAGTEAQKQAVAVFKTAVRTASEARKSVVDAAITAFRAEVERLLSDRKSAVETAVAGYKSVQKSAFDKAQSSCGSGVDPKTVLETLRIELKAAKDKFEADRRAIEKVADQVKVLNETKKAVFEKAHQDFRTALARARADLKAAFPQSTSTTTPVLSPSLSP